MKNIVITGSTRGIGLCMAEEFLRSGCNVTISGRGESLSGSITEKLSEYSGQYLYLRCDVQDRASVQDLWDESHERWGGVDIWINNAGQNTPYRYAWETDIRHTENVIKTNITGMIYGCQVAAVGMIKDGRGAIYSMEGLGSNNMLQKKTILYGTTKHALTYFMKGLAKELKDTGVIAGRLSPGMMLTDFITKTSDGEPSDVISDDSFKKVFNILADKPQRVAEFFIPRILANTRNDAQITWLTKRKAAWRFMTAGFRRKRLI
ncbi:MAG: SDR family NAD(P)-dependent oxidoreductase [Eubacteriales bacterium]|nr:SDR family NAD(P)-dependent oxidoreductase [Eubacteriales bacterium]